MRDDSWVRAGLALAALLAAAPATAGAEDPIVTAEPWPAADRLFRCDPRWQGGDAAYSVPLGGDRVLWLFGDSFVAAGTAPGRRGCRMVSNSIAVQRGLDPATASLTFCWRTRAGRPAAYFPDGAGRRFWPQGGLRVGDRLVIFLERVRTTPGEGLGFRADGWRVALVENPDAAPRDWRVRILPPPPGPRDVVVGLALWRDGDDVVALGIREPGDHAGLLVRWPAAELAAGRLAGARWWAGDSAGWLPADRLVRGPVPVLDDAGPECSLHRDARLGRWVHVRTVGFGAADVGIHFAARPEGPWPATRIVYRPPESDRPEVSVYAGKGHPELAGADLVVTYASNTFAEFGTLVADTTLYYPRFVRLRFGAAPR